MSIRNVILSIQKGVYFKSYEEKKHNIGSLVVINEQFRYQLCYLDLQFNVKNTEIE